MSAKINGHEARMNTALAVAYQREGREAITTETPMTMAQLLEEGPGDHEEELKIRSEAVNQMLHFLFGDGPHPGCTTRRLYLLAQRLQPELILHMSGAELADMFGETRAAWSARNKRIFTGYLKARGAKGARGRLQKSETAAAKYAEAARGNTNRRGKYKTAA
jgi:hypothetical protein